MEKIAVVTDSCADVPKEYIEKYNIYVLPMVVLCEDKEYKDGIDIDAELVYEKQKTTVLKTSTPLGSDIIDTFDKIKKEGYTHVIAVLLSGGLSGTFNQVRLMAQSYEGLTIEVFDSKNGSIGYGVTVLNLAKYRDNGLGFNELKDKAEKLIENTYAYFSIDTLEYLEKGGRIGKAAAFIGGLINLKPILSFDKDSGEIFVPSKVRGRKKVQSQLIELISALVEKNPDEEFIIITADGAMLLEREEMENKLKECFPKMKELVNAKVGAALSAYLGPGLLGAGIQFI